MRSLTLTLALFGGPLRHCQDELKATAIKKKEHDDHRAVALKKGREVPEIMVYPKKIWIFFDEVRCFFHVVGVVLTLSTMIRRATVSLTL